MTNRSKNKDENEKVWENKFDFGILHIKIRILGNSHKVGEKTRFLGHFWLIEAKIKMKMKKYGNMFSTFEFSISKLGYKELLIKIWEKSFFSKFLPEKDIVGQRCQKC